VIERLEQRIFLSGLGPDSFPQGDTNTPAEGQPMALRQPASVTLFNLLDGNENYLAPLGDGRFDMRPYLDRGLTEFRFEAVTKGKVSSVSISVNGATPEIQTGYKYATSRRSSPDGSHNIAAGATGPYGSGGLKITVDFYDSKADQPPPDQPDPVKVVSVSLTRNNVVVGPLTNNATYTPEQLEGTRAVANLEGTTSKVTFLLVGPSGVLKGPSDQFDAPYDWSLPPLTDGLYQIVFTPEGGDALATGFQVKAVVQPPDGNGDDLAVVEAVVGRPVHVKLDAARLAVADSFKMNWTWDFGDALSPYNKLVGFSGAHEFKAPGSYVLSLDGVPQWKYLVAADTRPVYQINSASDLYSKARLGNAILVLPEGDTFLSTTVWCAANTEIRAHTNGSRALWNGARGSGVRMFGGLGLTLRGFKQGVAGMGEQTGNLNRLGLALCYPKDDTSIIGIEVENVDDIANCNEMPRRVYVAENSQTWITSLRAYGVWGEGEQLTVIGNNLTNSVVEHLFRFSSSTQSRPGSRFVLVAHNFGRNADRRPFDPDDIGKSSCIFQVGEWASAYHNDFDRSGTGPLSNEPADAPLRFRNVMVVDNKFNGTYHVDHGAERVWLTGNEWSVEGVDKEVTIHVAAFHAGMNRGVTNLVIEGNRIASKLTRTRLLWVRGEVYDQFEVVDNVFALGDIAMTGDHPLIFDINTKSHYLIDNNVLAPSKLTSNVVAKVSGASLNLEQFNALPGVGINTLP
jgi:hypothetical protein